MEFPCTGCGECCRRLQAVLEANHEHPVLKELVERFPFKTTESGACEMLTDDNRCSVYDQRPLLCNIKAGGVLMGVEESKWYLMNQDYCNSMMDEVGLDVKYRVSL